MEFMLLLSSYLIKFLIACVLGVSIFYIINIGNKFVENNKKLKISKKYLLITLLIIISTYIIIKVYQEAEIIKELFYTILISLIFAYILNPAVNYLEKKKIKRIYGVALVYIILLGFTILAISIIIPTMAQEIKVLGQDLPSYFEELDSILNRYYEIYTKNINNLPKELSSVKDSIDENVNQIQDFLINALKIITSTIFNAFSKILSIILIPVLTFYFIKDKEYFKKTTTLLIPKKYRSDFLVMSRKINDILGKFVRGQLIVASFIGVATSLGLLFLKIKFAFIIGILAGIFSIIPYFGPIIGIIPAILFALLDKPIKIVWVIVLFIVIQQIEGDILSPKIVGDSVGLHPVTVMLSLLVGGSLMGILGLLLAVPVVAILRVVINSVVEKISSI